jgi:hypothetical protein
MKDGDQLAFENLKLIAVNRANSKQSDLQDASGFSEPLACLRQERRSLPRHDPWDLVVTANTSPTPQPVQRLAFLAVHAHLFPPAEETATYPVTSWRGE